MCFMLEPKILHVKCSIRKGQLGRSSTEPFSWQSTLNNSANCFLGSNVAKCHLGLVKHKAVLVAKDTLHST